MCQRSVKLTGVLVTITGTSLLMVAVAGQGLSTQVSAQTAKGGSVLETSWGEPNLEGIWSDEYQIPLQRAAKNAGKELFTDAERAQLDKERSAKPFGFGDKRAAKGTENDVAGAYDSRVFTSRRPTGRRTSLIVDPPDGKIPPVTPAIEKRNAELRQ